MTVDWRARKLDSPTEDGRSHMERMRAGDWFKYRAGPELAQLQMATKRTCRELSDGYWADPDAATKVLTDLLAHCGPGLDFRPPFFIEYAERMHVGSDVFINTDFMALGSGTVTIGDGALIGPCARFYTPNHAVDAALRAQGWEVGLPITVGDRAWLGGSVVLCPGVTIGPDAVVGAGAVVTKDVPAGAIVGGNPARVIGHI